MYIKYKLREITNFTRNLYQIFELKKNLSKPLKSNQFSLKEGKICYKMIY